MLEIRNQNIKLKEKLNRSDYDDINTLKKLCLETGQTTLKLELDYKLDGEEAHNQILHNINEFMYYDKNNLIGYIGICYFGGDSIEVNGMVHPSYRRKGVFKKLFSLVNDEWKKRESQKMLLLSDANSIAGLGFIKNTGARYDHSEYEMFLRDHVLQERSSKSIIIRKATNRDAKNIAWQNAIYFDIEYMEEDATMPEEEEKLGTITYIAEVNNEIIGKVKLEIRDGIGGIYGLGVIPEYRGKGYGREILSMAIEKLKERNPQSIMLQVEVKNKNALSLYKSCGFEEASTMDYYKISNK